MTHTAGRWGRGDNPRGRPDATYAAVGSSLVIPSTRSKSVSADAKDVVDLLDDLGAGRSVQLASGDPAARRPRSPVSTPTRARLAGSSKRFGPPPLLARQRNVGTRREPPTGSAPRPRPPAAPRCARAARTLRAPSGSGLVACGPSNTPEYEYTQVPPLVIGSDRSGLRRRRDRRGAQPPRPCPATRRRPRGRRGW